MSALLSVCPSAWNNSATVGLIFMKLTFDYFLKIFQKIQIQLKYDKNNECVSWRPIYIFVIPRSFLLKVRNGKSCTDNQNTHCMFSNFFSKIMPFMRQWGKVCRPGQTTDDNVAHGHC
jgi:hypothetical protein